MLSQQRRRALRADARRTRQFVRRIAAQRDEVRHLMRVDSVAFADLGRADARHFAGPHGIEDRRRVRGELERVAVAARDQHGPVPLLFRGDGGGEKIVSLVAGALGGLEAAGLHELRQHIQLFDDGIVEFAPALIRGILFGAGRSERPACPIRPGPRAGAPPDRGAAACWRSRGWRRRAFRHRAECFSEARDRRDARRNRRR